MAPSIRPLTPRSTACKSWPRSSTRSAAIVPTGVRHCEHVDLAAQRRRAEPGPRRAARGARGDPAEPDVPGRRACRPCASSCAWWPSAPPPRTRSNGRGSRTTPRSTPNTPGRARVSSRSTQSLDREARSDDEQRRRSIIDAAMAGESKAKADFASASRRIASEFDTLRESAKNELQPRQEPRPPASSSPASARRPRSTPQRMTALERRASTSPTAIRDRLATLAAEYRKFKLNPELPPPVARVLLEVRRPGR